jgi:hypothetical protein
MPMNPKMVQRGMVGITNSRELGEKRSLPTPAWGQEGSLLQSELLLFCAQGSHGVDCGGAPGRHYARRDRYEQQQERRG